MDLREIIWNVIDRSHLTQHREEWRAVVKTVVKVPVPQNPQWLVNWRLLKKDSIPQR
jgi:hypothetical protein